MEEKKTNTGKVNFFLGFFAGLALLSVVGFIVMIAVVFSNGEKVDLAAQAQQDDTTVVEETTDTTQTAQPVKAISEDDHYKGDLNAPIQFIIYDDFECPYCLKHEATLAQLEAEYGDQIVFVYRHFPLSFHANAQKAAEASECAAEQGKFWEMHDKLFDAAEAGELGVDKFKSIASELGLNTTQFNTCLDSGQYYDKVQQDLQEGALYGVQGTPGNFVNGNLVSGAYPFEQFKAFIDDLLAAQ